MITFCPFRSERLSTAAARFSLICLVGMLISTVPAAAQDTARLLRESVHRLQAGLLSQGAYSQARNQVLLGDLETQVAMGVHADPHVLDQIHQRFQRFAGTYNHPHFQSTAEAIAAHRDHLHDVQSLPLASEDLAAEAMARVDRFQDISASQLNEHRERIVGILQDIQGHVDATRSMFGNAQLEKRTRLKPFLSFLQETPFSDENLQVPDSGESIEQRRFIAGYIRQVNGARDRFRAAAIEDPYISASGIESRLIDFSQTLLDSASKFAPESRKQIRLQNRFQRTMTELAEDLGKLSDPTQRDVATRVGRALGFLERAGQAPDLVTRIRQQHSHSNFRVVLGESLANRLASQPVSDARLVDEVILDNRVEGVAYTNGYVTLDFVNDPQQVHARIQLQGRVMADNYTEKGPVTAYASGYSNVGANRSIFANIGGLMATPPHAYADLSTQFLGVNIGLINGIAYRQYLKRKQASEAIGAERTRQRVYNQFASETDAAIENGRTQLGNLRRQRVSQLQQMSAFRRDFAWIGTDLEQRTAYWKPDSPFLPPLTEPGVFARTTDRHLYVVADAAGWNQLGAPSAAPKSGFPVDVRVQMHESFLSNLVAPLLEGREFDNTDFTDKPAAFLNREAARPDSQLDPQVIADLREQIELARPKADDKPFSITFDDSRPIQFEFDNNQVSISVFGKSFRQEQSTYREPMRITVRLKLVRHQGELKLMRQGKPEVNFATPGAKGAAESAFRSALEEQIQDKVTGDALEEAVILPSNLIPLDLIRDRLENPDVVTQMKLVQARSEGGWLTLGWTFVPARASVSGISAYPMDIPAIEFLEGDSVDSEDSDGAEETPDDES